MAKRRYHTLSHTHSLTHTHTAHTYSHTNTLTHTHILTNPHTHTLAQTQGIWSKKVSQQNPNWRCRSFLLLSSHKSCFCLVERSTPQSIVVVLVTFVQNLNSAQGGQIPHDQVNYASGKLTIVKHWPQKNSRLETFSVTLLLLYLSSIWFKMKPNYSFGSFVFLVLQFVITVRERETLQDEILFIYFWNESFCATSGVIC